MAKMVRKSEAAPQRKRRRYTFLLTLSYHSLTATCAYGKTEAPFTSTQYTSKPPTDCTVVVKRMADILVETREIRNVGNNEEGAKKPIAAHGGGEYTPMYGIELPICIDMLGQAEVVVLRDADTVQPILSALPRISATHIWVSDAYNSPRIGTAARRQTVMVGLRVHKEAWDDRARRIW